MYQQLVTLNTTDNVTYKRNNKTRSGNHRCRGKDISITYSQCVSVALGIQHVMRMRHIILSPVACPALQYFSRLSQKGNDFRKEVIERNTCVLIFSTTSILNISHSKQN